MIPDDTCVLVAVSGGLDSVVLLDVLARLSSDLPFSIVIGHVGHGLRGDASTRDASFVQELAASHELPIVMHRVTQHELQQAHSQGREGAARHARYQALQALADEAGATRIALGHHLDDHAETILHHLTRGTGPTGLRGIPAVRLPFIRPLLDASREQILSYGVEHALTWREDASNADLTYTRNRIRYQILPEFKILNPRFIEALSRNADLLTDLDKAVAFLVAERLEQLIDKHEDSEMTLHRNELAVAPHSVCRLMLREAIRKARGTLEGIELTHVDAMIDLIKGQRTHGELSLPGLYVRMQQDVVDLSLARMPEPQPWSVPAELGETLLPDGKLTLELDIISKGDADLASARSNPWIEFADADRVTFLLHVRTRQSGDCFTPLGLTHDVKLNDFLINEQAPFFERDTIPLLCDRDAILWVIGMRLSEPVKLSDRTQRVLRMRIKGVE